MSDPATKRSRELPKPVGLALIVCDDVYKDDGGKQALIGLFNNLRLPGFPFVYPRLCVFGSMTEVRYGTECRVDIVHADTETVVAAQSSVPPPREPTAECEFVCTLKAIRFPEPGTYFVRLFANGEIILQRRFKVMPSGGKK
jgi:hypothetical protein